MICLYHTLNSYSKCDISYSENGISWNTTICTSLCLTSSLVYKRVCNLIGLYGWHCCIQTLQECYKIAVHTLNEVCDKLCAGTSCSSTDSISVLPSNVVWYPNMDHEWEDSCGPCDNNFSPYWRQAIYTCRMSCTTHRKQTNTLVVIPLQVDTIQKLNIITDISSNHPFFPKFLSLHFTSSSSTLYHPPLLSFPLAPHSPHHFALTPSSTPLFHSHPISIQGHQDHVPLISNHAVMVAVSLTNIFM